MDVLARKENIDRDILKSIVYEYWNNTNNDQYYPSQVYIQSRLGKGTYLEPSAQVREQWAKNYSKPLKFKSKELLDAAKEEALSFFPKEVIYEYKDFNGEYVLAVKTPVEKYNPTIEDYIGNREPNAKEKYDFELVTGIKLPKAEGPQKFTFNDGVTVNAPFELNYQQEEALNAMNDFVKSDQVNMTLSGYAGTGKTSIMEMFAQKMEKQGRNVIFCATTHKAAAVLNDRVSKSGYSATTLHRTFGLNAEVDTSKENYDAKSKRIKVTVDKIPMSSVIVIDEASMINEEAYGIINDIAAKKGLKIIYVGDEAQLAPVKENQISKVFRNNNGNIQKLSIVERTGDNAILKEATDLRNGNELSGESSFNKKGQGVAYISNNGTTSSNKLNDVVKHFAPKLKDNPNEFRILAMRNETVAKYNEQVRKILGYDTPTPRKGEPMMAYDNWGWQKSGSKPYRIINSESYTVAEVYPDKSINVPIKIRNQYNDGELSQVVTLQVTPIVLEDAFGERETVNYIDIKNNPANREAATQIALAKSEAWDRKRKATTAYLSNKYGDEIQQYENALFVNDNIKVGSGKNERTIQSKVIDFGYAMTIHKSQGSTFKNVLIDDVDIDTAPSDSYNNPYMDLDAEEPTNIPTSEMQPDKAEEVDLGDLSNIDDTFINEAPASSPSDDNNSDSRRQLRYVAVSRATDTVTLLSSPNKVKREGSPIPVGKEIRTTSDGITYSIEAFDPN